MRLTRRVASQADLPFLLALRSESMGPHLDTAGIDRSDEAQLARVLHRFECAELLLADGKPVGLLKLRREPGAWRLLQIQLAQAVRGQGLGQRVLQEVLADAAQSGARVTLTVLKANPAKALYERLGFRVTGEDEHEFHMAAG